MGSKVAMLVSLRRRTTGGQSIDRKVANMYRGKVCAKDSVKVLLHFRLLLTEWNQCFFVSLYLKWTLGIERRARALVEAIVSLSHGKLIHGFRRNHVTIRTYVRIGSILNTLVGTVFVIFLQLLLSSDRPGLPINAFNTYRYILLLVLQINTKLKNETKTRLNRIDTPCVSNKGTRRVE